METLKPIDVNIECPCRNGLLENTQGKSLDLGETLSTRLEPIGKFYVQQEVSGPLFSGAFFEENPEYEGGFEVNSPLKIFLEITGRCNLKCKGCYVPFENATEYDFEKLKAIIDDLADSGVMGIQLLGGEPTLYKHLVELCMYIKSKNIRLEMVSNGMLLDEELVVKLKDYLDYCAISIDGGEKTHNNLRGNPNSFVNAVLAFQLLQKHGIGSEIIMTVNKANIDEIETVFELCGRDVSKLYVKVMHFSTMMNESQKALALEDEEISRVKEIVEELGIGFQIPVSSFKKPGKSTFFGCPGGIITGVIDKDGNVYKCLYQRRDPMGNVFSNNIKEIWAEDNMRREKLKTQVCRSCDNNKNCGGFCDLHSDRPRFL